MECALATNLVCSFCCEWRGGCLLVQELREGAERPYVGRRVTCAVG